MKLNEFLDDNLIKTIDKFIFFDEKWMFPEKDSLLLFLDNDIPDWYFKFAYNVIDEMNIRKIDPAIYTSDIFNQIIKDIKFV